MYVYRHSNYFILGDTRVTKSFLFRNDFHLFLLSFIFFLLSFFSFFLSFFLIFSYFCLKGCGHYVNQPIKRFPQNACLLRPLITRNVDECQSFAPAKCQVILYIFAICLSLVCLLEDCPFKQENVMWKVSYEDTAE